MNYPFSGPRKAYAAKPAGSGLAICILVAWVMIYVLNEPGQLSTDSVMELAEGRSGVSWSFQPPFVSVLMRVFDQIHRGTAIYLLFTTALFFIPAIGIALTARRVRIVPTLLFLICLVSPMFVVYQGIIWKDVLFANSVVFAFYCLKTAIATPVSLPIRRALWLGGAVIGATLAAEARQNGLICIVFLALAWGFRDRPGRRHRRWASASAVALSSIVLLAGAKLATDRIITQHLNTFGVGIRIIQHFDVAAIAARAPADFHVPGLSRDEAARLRSEARQSYTPQRVDTLGGKPQITALWASSPVDDLRLWAAAIETYPKQYIGHRLAVFHWMAFPPDVGVCLPYWVGVDGPADTLAYLGLRPHVRASDARLGDYAHLFLRTPLYLNGFWLVGACILFALVWKLYLSRNSVWAAELGLLATAICFAASFLVIGIACDVRYMYVLPVSVAYLLLRLGTASGGTHEADAPRRGLT